MNERKYFDGPKLSRLIADARISHTHLAGHAMAWGAHNAASGTIAGHEKGIEPRGIILGFYCDFFKVSPSELFTTTPSKEASPHGDPNPNHPPG